MPDVLTATRYGVFGVFVLAVAAATASWLVRTQRVSPFTALGRGLKKLSDPLLKPVEARVFRAGGNPVRAGWWLVVGVAVAGVLLISIVSWISDTAAAVGIAADGGPRAQLATIIRITFRVLYFALLARVILSWIGIGRYTTWMRPVYWLTDWFVAPIRRLLPPFGAFDWSPLAAFVALWLGERLVLAVLLQR